MNYFGKRGQLWVSTAWRSLNLQAIATSTKALDVIAKSKTATIYFRIQKFFSDSGLHIGSHNKQALRFAKRVARIPQEGQQFRIERQS